MKMKTLCGAVGLSAALAIMLLNIGCEEGPDVSEAVNYFDDNPLTFNNSDIATDSLSIVPIEMTGSAGLQEDGQTVVLTAGGGTSPYTWDVHDIALGAIIEVDNYGSFAVYQRNQAGDNVVILRDRNGKEAYLRISQPM